MVNMDAMFTLPVISLVLIPTMSSYATTLNIIFFYMTWATLVFSHSHVRVELVGTLCVRFFCFMAPSLCFFLLDILIPSASALVKRNGELGLPCGRKRGSVRWKDIKVAGWSLLNVMMGLALQGLSEHQLIKMLGYPSAIKVAVTLPMPWAIARHLAFAFTFREILAYVIHRYVLHNPKSFLFGWMSHLHNEWFHSLEYPYPLTAHYDHPFVWILHRFIPTYVPAMLLRVHMVTYMIYLAIISLEETFVYAGYTMMPTNFFLGGLARRVEEHLHTRGGGNFGLWGVLDWIFTTAIEDDSVEEFMTPANAEELEDRVRMAMDVSRRNIRVDTLRRNTRGAHAATREAPAAAREAPAAPRGRRRGGQ